MHALLIAAHGSRRPQSNAEVIALAQQVAHTAAGRYGHISAAFLELASPSIEEGIRHCAAAGAAKITIVPYLLAAGRHVAEDIPEILQKMEQEFPDITLHLAPHIGASSQMSEVILASAEAS